MGASYVCLMPAVCGSTHDGLITLKPQIAFSLLTNAAAPLGLGTGDWWKIK